MKKESYLFVKHCYFMLIVYIGSMVGQWWCSWFDSPEFSEVFFFRPPTGYRYEGCMRLNYYVSERENGIYEVTDDVIRCWTMMTDYREVGKKQRLVCCNKWNENNISCVWMAANASVRVRRILTVFWQYSDSFSGFCNALFSTGWHRDVEFL